MENYLNVIAACACSSFIMGSFHCVPESTGGVLTQFSVEINRTELNLVNAIILINMIRLFKKFGKNLTLTDSFKRRSSC